MRRTVFGWLIMLHALAHAGVAMWAMERHDPWLIALFWGMALFGYFAAALGLLRLPWLRNQWELCLMIGVAATVIIAMLSPSIYSVTGALVAVAMVVIVLTVWYKRIEADIEAVNAVRDRILRHPFVERVGWVAGASFALYVTTVAVIRPVYLTWGTTPSERRQSLPGDSALPVIANYRVEHGIDIHAPAERVWPWVVQLGQDRGGFYSHAWLERAVGAKIVNANEIRPEWQKRAVGDTVFATQPNYLSGVFHSRPGWRVTAYTPGQAMVLENWGSFVVVPTGAQSSRLVIRTRGPGALTPLMFALAPINVFGFEPAHFIMQLSMMRGIRDRAERLTAAHAE